MRVDRRGSGGGGSGGERENQTWRTHEQERREIWIRRERRRYGREMMREGEWGSEMKRVEEKRKKER